MQMLFAFVILALLASVHAIGFHGLHFKGLKEPEWIGPRTLSEKWIEQPLDHFNHRDNRTWRMRYYEQDSYYNGSELMFIMLGGEWTIGPGFLQQGLMHDIGKKSGALLLYTEHRYYGKSWPTKDLSTENMQYLNVDQALADVAYVIKAKQEEYKMKNGTVIVFGGSYAGNMAAWIRIKYPHLIQGAVASSAPVYAKADFYEYLEVVTNSIKRYDEKCVANIKTAFEQVENLIVSENGSETLAAKFNLCKTINVSSSNDVSYFMEYLAEVFAGAVQYNIGEGKYSSIATLCNYMTNTQYDEPIDKLSALIVQQSGCLDISYSMFIEALKEEDASNINAMRQWFFQTCTEYGYYQTTNSDKSVFGSLFPIDFFVSVCSDVYGEYYERGLLEKGVTRTNLVYGGNIPDVTNVIFSNGDVDPWHSLSVLQDLNEHTPAILIPGASHCQDLQPDSYHDTPELKEARKRIRNIVYNWILQSQH